MSEGVLDNFSVVTWYIDKNSNNMTIQQLKYLQVQECGNIFIRGVSRQHKQHAPKRYMQSIGILVNGFFSGITIYPCGATNPMARKLVTKYYKTGSNIVHNNLSNDIPQS